LANLIQKVRKQIVQAISDYSMLEDGDRVLVCVSGGNYEGQIQKCK